MLLVKVDDFYYRYCLMCDIIVVPEIAIKESHICSMQEISQPDLKLWGLLHVAILLCLQGEYMTALRLLCLLSLTQSGLASQTYKFMKTHFLHVCMFLCMEAVFCYSSVDGLH